MTRVSTETVRPEATRRLHERWTVRWVACVIAGLIGAAFPAGAFIVDDDYHNYFTVLWSIAYFLSQMFALLTWRFGRSSLLGWVMLLFPMLDSILQFAFVAVPPYAWVWPLLDILADFGYVLFGWLSMADDDGHLSTLRSRVVAGAFAVYAGLYCIIATLFDDSEYLGDTRSPYAPWPNGAVFETVLEGPRDVLPVYVFPLAILAVMVWNAIVERGRTRGIRWGIAGVFGTVLAWDFISELTPIDVVGSPVLGATSVFVGVLDRVVIPTLVVIGLRIARRAEEPASVTARTAAVVSP